MSGQPLTTADLGPLADDPQTLREAQAREQLRKAEQRELMRIAAQSALDRSGNGSRLDPQARAWAKQWSAIKPLPSRYLHGSVPINELPEALL